VDPSAHDSYETRAPAPENLVSIFGGEWVSRLPGHPSGDVPLFDDERIRWALARSGDLTGRRVLELGPLEGGHSYMLQQAGAGQVRSIEANHLSYLKCLVVQQLYGLDKVSFEYGNFVPWLDGTDETYDLAIAAGVLYHTVDPVGVLEDLCRVSPQLFIWTHYADEEAMPETDPRYEAGIVGVEEADYRGTRYRLFRRRYQNNTGTDRTFCGGVHANPAWIERSTIVEVLELNGFAVEVGEETPNHPNGPAANFYARRRSAPARLVRSAARRLRLR
jgi:hypothetical protein